MLGGEQNVNVNWCDFDSSCRTITLNDEQKHFEWKLPNESLFKSATHVCLDKKKKFVITLFYTTETVSLHTSG